MAGAEGHSGQVTSGLIMTGNRDVCYDMHRDFKSHLVSTPFLKISLNVVISSLCMSVFCCDVVNITSVKYSGLQLDNLTAGAEQVELLIKDDS